MQLKINRQELLSKLNAAKSVVASKPLLPILECVKISNESITASDGDNTIIIPLVTEGNFEFCVSAKTLSEAVSKIKDMEITVDVTDVNLTINHGRGSMTIPVQDSNDYPQSPTITDGSSFTTDTKTFVDMVRRSVKSSGDDELRPVMNGVFVEVDGGYLYTVASDGHRLYSEKTSVDSELERFNFILNKKTAFILSKLPTNGECSISADSRNSFIEIDGIKLTSRLIDGRFPNWRSVVPQNSTHKAIVSKEDMLDSLSRLSVSASGVNGLCKLSFSMGTLCLSAQDIDFSLSATETLDIQAEVFDLEIGFKLVFLKSLLENISTDNVVFHLSDATRAGLILPESDNDDVVQLLMPMML